MYEVARYIALQSADNPVIFFGDFNVTPEQLGYNIARILGALTDTYATLFPDDPGPTITPRNPYKSGSLDKKRIDYIMTRNGSDCAITAVDIRIAFQLLPGSNGQVAYSDHFGVIAELELTNSTVGFDHPSSKETENIMRQLYALLLYSFDEARARESGHIVQFGLGVIGIAGIYGISKRLEQRWKRVGVAFRYSVTSVAAFYTILKAGSAILSVPDEISALEAILSEIKIQLEAGRAFNGVRFEASQNL
jgi:hypothetical protein